MLKFSIIIPVYNASKFVGGCIESCINQSYSNIEVICVDDCSIDDSRQILESYQNKDNRIKCFFHTKNESQYMARRTGVENCTGDYILFLDSDDLLIPEACSLLAKQIDKTHADIIQFGYKENPGGMEVFSPFYKTPRERILAYMARENRYSPEVWTKAYNRNLIVKAYSSMDIFYASGSEDVYTSIVLAYFANTFSFLKKPLVNYSINIGWSTRKVYDIQIYHKWLLSYQTVIQKTKEFILKYAPEYTMNCLDMELYMLKDFISCRIAPEISLETKHELYTLLPQFFSQEAYTVYFDDLLAKSNEYNIYLNYNNSSFKNRTKKLIRTILRYCKFLF